MTKRLSGLMSAAQKKRLQRWLYESPIFLEELSKTRLDHEHFDALFGADGVPKIKEELIAFSYELLNEATNAIRKSDALSDVRHVIVLLPFEDVRGRSRRTTWRDSDWDRIVGVRMPPVLIVMKRDFPGRVREEYYKYLEPPVDGYPEVATMFSSWTQDKATQNQFTTGIYLYSTLSPQ